jgi:hypothetical protein
VKRLHAAWYPSPFNRAKKKKPSKSMTIINRRKKEEKKEETEEEKTKSGVNDELYSRRFCYIV